MYSSLLYENMNAHRETLKQYKRYFIQIIKMYVSSYKLLRMKQSVESDIQKYSNYSTQYHYQPGTNQHLPSMMHTEYIHCCL